VVGGTWHGRDDGPGGNPVFLTHAAGEKPLQPCEASDDCRLIEPYWIKARQPPWRVKHPPQNTARAVRVPLMLTWLLGALAMAYRLPGEHADLGHEPVGWQRWRRPLMEQTRDHVISLPMRYARHINRPR
jgi:hypothetical protein